MQRFLEGCLFFLVTWSLGFTEYSPRVSTQLGDIIGIRQKVRDKEVDAFLGIPYALPPVAERRFRKPHPIGRYSRVIEAKTLPPGCPQVRNKFFTAQNIILKNMSEDCLHLNVWRPVPRESELKPVLVWIYGGGFMVGWSSFAFYHGDVFAAMNDVIVVTVNYRVGALGFYSGGSRDSPGNLGLYDQNLALKWVKNNIISFGGDPNRVTLFGESAGAISVAFHMISPLSEGLFQKAILESGTSNLPLMNSDKIRLEFIGNIFSEKIGCNGSQIEKNQCLREKPFQEILKSEDDIVNTHNIDFLPVVGEEFLPLENVKLQKAAHTQNIDVLLGINKNEGDFILGFIFQNLNLKDPEKMVTLSQGKFLLNNFIANMGNDKNPEKYTKHYFLGISENDVFGVRKAMSRIVMDWMFLCPKIFFADRQAILNPKIRFYRYTHVSSVPMFPEWMDVTHFDEIPFVFGVPLRDLLPYGQRDKDFSEVLMNLWSDFAKGRDFNKEWPLYKPFEFKAKELNATVIGEPPKKIPGSEVCYTVWKPWFDTMYDHIKESSNEDLPAKEESCSK